MNGEREESDQLPEEGPGGQVPDDDCRRSRPRRRPGERGRAGEGSAEGGAKQATGNPANAGQD